MVFKVRRKYCRNNLVQVMPYSGITQLIIGCEGIILLKIGNQVIINKYQNHVERYRFPYSDHEQSDAYHFNALFQYDKTYLNYNVGIDGIALSQLYFTPFESEALVLNESLDFDKGALEEQVLTRKEIEDFFNPENYDQMYILDISGKIKLAKSCKDDYSFLSKIIPSDEEIIEQDLIQRRFYLYLVNLINENSKLNEANIQKRPLDKIKNLEIYGHSSLTDFQDIMITFAKGQFLVSWFQIDFLEPDKFRLTLKKIPLKEISSEALINYATTNEIEYTKEPAIALPRVFSDESEKDQPKTFLKKIKATFGRKK